MRMTAAVIRPRLLFITWMVALLLVPMLLATPVQADEREERLRAAFDRLSIATEELVPVQLQPAFTAKVDAAEIALLVPAVQKVPVAASRACPSVYVLTSIQHQARAMSERLGWDPTAYIEAVGEVIELISIEFPVGHCTA